MTREQFAKRLLNAFGLKVTQRRLNALIAWESAEGTKAKFNPLATTKVEPGATDYNTTHVKNYPNLDTGVRATHDTLAEHHGQGYEPIVKGLIDNEPAHDILMAVARSSWGTGALALSVLPYVKEDYELYANKPIGQ